MEVNNIDSFVRQNLKILDEKVIKVMRSLNKKDDNLMILAVSKSKSLPYIQAAYKYGLRNFGENYLQEALLKINSSPRDIRWHYIGNIQSRKIKLIAENFSWVHTVSSLTNIKKLNDYRAPNKDPLNICIQININNEKTKSGIQLSDHESINKIIDQLQYFQNINLRGLMCIPKKENDYIKQRDNFHILKDLLVSLNLKYNLNLDTLSMGMSNDMEAAIQSGSSIIRIGQAIFGKRT
jgi:pyridoxal phosphate enzyme (YggS family)